MSGKSLMFLSEIFSTIQKAVNSIANKAGRHMAEKFYSTPRQRLRDFFNLRWLMILAGLAVQVIALATVLAHLGTPASADITLEPVVGSQGVCQVVALRPFSEPWLSGALPGIQVRIEGTREPNPCAIATQKIQIVVVGLPAPSWQRFEVTIQAQPVNFLDLALVVFLAIIFNVTGIAIFLRSQNRPLARVAYALFTCTGLVLCLIDLRGASYLWLDLLGFTVAMLIRGLSVTLVCLFAYPIGREDSQRHLPIRPYLPLLAGIGLAIFSAFLPSAPVMLRLAFILLNC